MKILPFILSLFFLGSVFYLSEFFFLIAVLLNFKTFRIGLFGLDKLYNVDAALDRLQNAVDKVFE